jgi:hypothetical protein
MCLAAESAQRRTVEVRVIVGRKYMEILYTGLQGWNNAPASKRIDIKNG